MKESKSDHVKRWRKSTKQRMVNAMGGACQCCGYHKCMESLDFHHIDADTKEITLSKIRANPKSWLKIVEELKKCVLVCRNCHGEIHNQERKIPENYIRFDERYIDYKAMERETGLTNECPVCKKQKPIHNNFCSLTCSSIARGHFDWDSIDLKEEIKINTIQSIADKIGLSNQSVSKKLDKLGLRKDYELIHNIVKISKPTKVELQKLILEKPMTKIAKDFNVSEAAIRKWCKKYNIHKPPHGFWIKKVAAKVGNDPTTFCVTNKCSTN